MDPQINLDGSLFHKPCAKCQDCNCQITLTNFTKTEIEGATVLLCKTHYFKRFKEGGSYVGGEKFQVKNTRDVQAEEKRASMNLTKRDTSGTAPVTSTVVTAEEDGAAGLSVRDRISSLKTTNAKATTPEKAATPPTAVKEPVVVAVVEPYKPEERVLPMPIPPAESVPKADHVDIVPAEPESSPETKSAVIEEALTSAVVAEKEEPVVVVAAVFQEEVHSQPQPEPLAAEIEA
jgi:hypothetical protein